MMQAFPPSSALLGTPLTTHGRSISLGLDPSNSNPQNKLAKARSTTSLRTMARAQAPALSAHSDGPEVSFHTLADPRTSSQTDLSKTASSSPHHPDLSNEVAALSDKLISAINHQTSLDDALAQTRHELEASKARIAKLEAEAKEHTEKITEERKQKTQIQQEKRGIEAELENLTASLFDEANKMVASANQQREATEKKNQQLRDQIKDGEAVIASQTQQLTELKELMQQIGTDYRKELESPGAASTPSSPGMSRDEASLARLLESMNLSAVSPDQEILPSPSTTLTHLLKPLCRIDIPAYEDFRNLVQTSSVRSHNPSHAPSRAGSGTYNGLHASGMTNLNNGSSPNLNQTTSPNIPGSFSPNTEMKGPTPLKDTRFFKRIMAEDVEPTLRLDLSPTISWLNRRSILAALTDNSLMVEPIPEASLKLYGRYTPCAMCGEHRKEGQNPRTHAMRVREGEGATKWSICKLCLEKVRSVGDLIAYVRMVREGVVKVGDRKDEEEAWEELIRLRERLFWARMAGGVIPSFIPSTKASPVVGVEKNILSGNENINSTDGDTSDPSQQATGEAGEANEDQETESDREARLQLQQALDETLTTFDNIKEKRISQNSQGATTPPTTPPRKRESGGFPKISIPTMPRSFWEAQVNTLH